MWSSSVIPAIFHDRKIQFCVWAPCSQKVSVEKGGLILFIWAKCNCYFTSTFFFRCFCVAQCCCQVEVAGWYFGCVCPPQQKQGARITCLIWEIKDPTCYLRGRDSGLQQGLDFLSGDRQRLLGHCSLPKLPWPSCRDLAQQRNLKPGLERNRPGAVCSPGSWCFTQPAERQQEKVPAELLQAPCVEQPWRTGRIIAVCVFITLPVHRRLWATLPLCVKANPSFQGLSSL